MRQALRMRDASRSTRNGNGFHFEQSPFSFRLAGTSKKGDAEDNRSTSNMGPILGTGEGGESYFHNPASTASSSREKDSYHL